MSSRSAWASTSRPCLGKRNILNTMTVSHSLGRKTESQSTQGFSSYFSRDCDKRHDKKTTKDMFIWARSLRQRKQTRGKLVFKQCDSNTMYQEKP